MATNEALLVLADGDETLVRNDLLLALGAFHFTKREISIALALVASVKGASVGDLAERTRIEVHHVRDTLRRLLSAQVVARDGRIYRIAEPSAWKPGENKKARRGVPRGLRFQVLERDGFRCAYCGATAQEERLEVDHRVPVAAGGRSELENLTTACQPCNRGKGGRHG